MTASGSLDSKVDRAAAVLEPGLDLFEAAARLRRELGPERARAAAELYHLRQRARVKFPCAGSLWLTKKGLEQASDQRVAAVRARRIASWVRREAPDAWVVDATAGLGGDSLALRAAGLSRVVSAEYELQTALMLAWNLAAVGPDGPGGTPGVVRVVRQRAERPAIRADVLLLDPDRRGDGERIGDPSRWSPPFAACVEQAARCRGACVKLPPAVDVDRLDVPASLPHSWSWVSLRGELKEVTLWTGDLARQGGGVGRREVVAVAADGTAASWTATPLPGDPLDEEGARGVRFLADPDPGVVRSGLLGALAAAQGMRPLAPEIAYLGGERAPDSPLLRTFEVLGASPLDRRRVRAMLVEHGIGPVTVKKRGHPDDAGEIARRMRGRGANHGTLVVTRLGNGHHAYLVRPVRPPQGSERT